MSWARKLDALLALRIENEIWRQLGGGSISPGCISRRVKGLSDISRTALPGFILTSRSKSSLNPSA